mmetsp:Transcript_6543/g.10309  ORF Transcript_6543/g.10309 Transcript_6543/m.10309 type:complete len:236 (-) Transcript_6543:512-1219(-)|eukprot:CAMPEP_0203784084 /NCGR_PEP_ID=MMETSP0100_2-20121128/267_1 /ASSEMBLY_ACC=CAM_ASM_000210 /TAXON_ID=96639 /ORGANISM=" , Strain NY0313808BC1" /LENGTH=235 /DNA_ID=CAMNT_0050686021 /DNA_START=176 /DNA_END=883 /DNA_ORIENTATION=+
MEALVARLEHDVRELEEEREADRDFFEMERTAYIQTLRELQTADINGELEEEIAQVRKLLAGCNEQAVVHKVKIADLEKENGEQLIELEKQKEEIDQLKSQQILYVAEISGQENKLTELKDAHEASLLELRKEMEHYKSLLESEYASKRVMQLECKKLLDELESAKESATVEVQNREKLEAALMKCKDENESNESAKKLLISTVKKLEEKVLYQRRYVLKSAQIKSHPLSDVTNF